MARKEKTRLIENPKISRNTHQDTHTHATITTCLLKVVRFSREGRNDEPMRLIL